VTPSTVEQRRLRLRHRSVDLVDEQHVREHGAGAEPEVAVALVVDRQSGDVRRLQVRRALDARGDRLADARGERAGEHRLRGARNVLEQNVAAACERHQDELDLLGLANHDTLDARL
jgi:phage host-nuclease inhibitor protein Gam